MTNPAANVETHWARRHFVALDHVQLAMPQGEEARGRAFYIDVLGMTELEKPANLASRGGAWFAGGDGASVQIHLGVESGFKPARKAHPAVLVSGLDELAARLESAGHPVMWDDDLPGQRRFFCDDPFGNRLEFIGSFDDDI
jgi:catechol 2,3-dioxygenase-like lactoylglutathione lyase family enzyme